MLRFSFRCFFQNTVSLFVPPAARGPVPRGLRLHGTVTAFKHRRGYGFVLAEGIARPSKTSATTATATAGDDAAPSEALSQSRTTAATTTTSDDKDWIGEYFFTRSALSGGFYVTEGERISFGIRPLTPEQLEKRRSHAVRRGVATPGAEASEEDAASGSAASALHVATRVMSYDLKTGTEAPIVPPVLSGKIVSWEDAEGVGTISELDTRGYFHEDAPRFSFTRDDVDIPDGAKLLAGRFVRFAAAPEPGSTSESASNASDSAQTEDRDGVQLPRAERVIIDVGNERRHSVRGSPISADTATTSFHGLIRDIVDNKYGFILDDLSGDSIFFHVQNTVPGSQLSPGDRVTYLLREISIGRHKGKKTCLKVALEDQDADASVDGSVGDGTASLHSSTPRSSGFGKSKTAPRDRKRRAPVEDDDDDFSLLD